MSTASVVIFPLAKNINESSTTKLEVPIVTELPSTLKSPSTTRFCCIVVFPVIEPPEVLNFKFAVLYAA